MMVFFTTFLHFFTWVSFPTQAVKDPCKIYGTIYVVYARNQSEVRVFLEENEAFADLVVYQQNNRFFADRSGQWHFTKDRRMADYWVYFEDLKGMADFSIAYTGIESFAGCKQ